MATGRCGDGMEVRRCGGGRNVPILGAPAHVDHRLGRAATHPLNRLAPGACCGWREAPRLAAPPPAGSPHAHPTPIAPERRCFWSSSGPPPSDRRSDQPARRRSRSGPSKAHVGWGALQRKEASSPPRSAARAASARREAKLAFQGRIRGMPGRRNRSTPASPRWMARGTRSIHHLGWNKSGKLRHGTTRGAFARPRGSDSSTQGDSTQIVAAGTLREPGAAGTSGFRLGVRPSPPDDEAPPVAARQSAAKTLINTPEQQHR